MTADKDDFAFHRQVSPQVPDSNPGGAVRAVLYRRPEPGRLARTLHRCIGEKLDTADVLSRVSRLRARHSTHDIAPELLVDADRAITSVQLDSRPGELFRQRVQILAACGGKIELNNVYREDGIEEEIDPL